MAPVPLDDSLLPWLRSIKRLRQLGDKPKLFLCLADCVKQFHDDERYRDDLRYLRVCIQYANCSPEPWKVLYDLERWNIGQGQALFYEAYAMCLENRKKFGDADATYKRGLLRQAHPPEKLESSYKLFRERMKTRIKRRDDRADQLAGDNSNEATAGHILRHQTDISQGVANLTNETHILSEPLPTHDRLDRSFEEIRLEYWFTRTKTIGGMVDTCKTSCRNATEPIVSMPHRLPAGSFGDETIQIRKFAAKAITGKETEFEDARHHGLVDPTINTKEALQDILNMFRKPLDIGKVKENGKSSKRQALRSMCNVASISFDRSGNSQPNKPTGGSKNEQTELSVFKGGDPVESNDQDPSFSACKDECLHSTGTEQEDHQDGFFVFVDEDLNGERKSHQEITSDLDIDHLKEATISNALVYDNKLEGSQPSGGFNNNPMEFHVFRDDDHPKVASQDFPFEANSRVKSAERLHEPSQNVYKAECLQKMSGDDSPNCMAMADEENQPNCFSVFKDEELDGKRKSHHERELGLGMGLSNEGKRTRAETICDDLPMKAVLSGDENLVQLHHDNCLPEEAAQSVGDEQGLGSKAVNTYEDGLETRTNQQIKTLLASDERYHLYSSSFAGSNESITLGKSFGYKTLDLGKNLKGIQDSPKGAKTVEFIVLLEEDNMEDTDTLLAFKVSKPACPWEFYICKQLDQRISPISRHLFQHTHEIHVYTNCSILVYDYLEDGSLQDLLHTYQARGQNMPEVICMFYTLEMLTMLDILLSEGFIHGNIIPQNLLLRNHSENWEVWTPNRPGCWKHQGLLLVDWSKSVDVRLLQDGRTFEGDSQDVCSTGTTEGSSSTSQVDIYGLCEVVHLLLANSPLERTESCAVGVGPSYKLTTSFQTCKNKELWRYFFTSLLNAAGSDCLRLIGVLRGKMEEHININPSIKSDLKFGLMKQNIMMTETFPRRNNHFLF